MAGVDNLARQRDLLPSISTLDFEKYRMTKPDATHYSTIPGVSAVKGIMSSPPMTYTGPPPPYSSAASTSMSGPNTSGYHSPPETSSRRSTRDEKESPNGNFLPSISEALKNVDVVPPPQQQYSSASAPNSAVAQTFTEAPKGPGNPFSQPTIPASALRSSLSSNSGQPDPSPTKTIPPPPIPPETRAAPPNIMSSPRTTTSSQRLSAAQPSTNPPIGSPFRTSYGPEISRPGYPFPDYQGPVPPQTTTGFPSDVAGKFEDARHPLPEVSSGPYGDTIKRTLDVFDAELALQEITDASLRTLEFSKAWTQRANQANRASYLTETLPPIPDIEEMIKQSHHMLENLNKLREVAVMQQHAINEQRARAAARGRHFEDESHAISEDFKAGGFAGGDAKKRRGKAAPPGRCHSCNRAETPEWRRGPDGARTLCNACGLHYAKLTRKIGANKAAVMTSSNLRPKSLNETRP